MKKRYAVLLFFMVLSIPLFLGIVTWQANKCQVLRWNMEQLEDEQKALVDRNRTLIAAIANLLAVDKLETNALNEMGMKKVRPEDVLLVKITGGKGSEL